MFPLDTVKTRIQASGVNNGVVNTFRSVLRERGWPGLMRGSAVIGAGCVPAHVGLFGAYEFAKSVLLEEDGEMHQPVRAAMCGGLATVVHDAILTPTDVVKQRLQMGGYKGALDCCMTMYKLEGALSFYRSLPTTLAMNIPYMGILAATNESLKTVFRLRTDGQGRSDRLLAAAPWYFLSAGVSGAFAAAATLPMDVVKTRLQTQGFLQQADVKSTSAAPRYTGISSTANAIFQEQGIRGFFNGFGPRVGLAMPAAAVCWGTYETIRLLLQSAAGAKRTVQAKVSASPPVQSNNKPRSQPVNSTPTQTEISWDEWDGKTPFWKHAVAGSCAGMMEHVAMYPIDTVKTRMQAVRHGPPLGAMDTIRVVLQERGMSGFMRGCFAIGAGCIPAHIGLFCTYEVAKSGLMDAHAEKHQPVRAALCGALATVVHDAVITPTDVIKQRLQLGRYKGTLDCMFSIWRLEGLRGFYRSLPTTLISECPFHGVLVASNESLKLIFGLGCRDGKDAKCNVGLHFVSTGISGMIAAVATQPLDVVKTRLQTQSLCSVETGSAAEVNVRYSGLSSAARLIYVEEGMSGLFRGTVPRLLFAAPSAAMCWGTYEVVKTLL